MRSGRFTATLSRCASAIPIPMPSPAFGRPHALSTACTGLHVPR